MTLVDDSSSSVQLLQFEPGYWQASQTDNA